MGHRRETFGGGPIWAAPRVTLELEAGSTRFCFSQGSTAIHLGFFFCFFGDEAGWTGEGGGRKEEGGGKGKKRGG